MLSAIRRPASSINDILTPQPIDWARLKRWDQLLAGLAEPSADAGAVDSLGRSALHFAAAYGEVEVVRALLRHGASVQLADRFGATPLHWACLKGHAAVVEVLVGAGADALVRATAGIFKGKSSVDMAAAATPAAEPSAAAKELPEALTAALGASLFEQRKVLGIGGFGTVIKAVRRDTGRPVALKAIRKPPRGGRGGGSDTDGARVERDVLSSVQHPFVVRLHSAFQTQQHLYLAIDYCGGGDLALHIRSSPGGRMGEHAAQFVGAELLLAIEALHAASIIHRDVKAENVLVDEAGHIRLADYNVAKRWCGLAAGERTYSVVCTPFSTAPEVLSGSGCGTAADWWSYGVVVFEMLAGRPPYPRDESLMHAQARLVYEILHGERAELPAATSDDAASLVDALLVRDETQRLTEPSALRAHPFFAGVRWAQLLAKQVPSPLNPATSLSRASSYADGLDVFNYPSVLGHATDHAAAAAGAPGSPSLPDDEPGGARHAGVEGWDYVADAGGSRGARLWRRARLRLDQLARLQGLTRIELLIFVLLTLAANAATGEEPGTRILPDLDDAPRLGGGGLGSTLGSCS